MKASHQNINIQTNINRQHKGEIKIMGKGDHIKVNRIGYTHHGIDTGDGNVIHYTGEVASKSNALVQKDRIDTFADGGKIKVIEYDKCLPVSEVIRRATSRLYEKSYSLIFNNCEHFARWCKTGEHKSEQVKDSTSTFTGVGVSTLATTSSISVVSATGTVVGLSGSGVMSGLASVGSIVGSGAVGGVVILASAPALASTLAMNSILSDDETLPSKEREARTAGRYASGVGAVSGIVGSVTAISVSGSVTGLSSAGITSGLAAIGSTVGSGMVAGTAITVAAPAVVTAAVSYGVYKVWQLIKK